MLRLIKSCKPIRKTNEKTAMNCLPSELLGLWLLTVFETDAL